MSYQLFGHQLEIAPALQQGSMVLWWEMRVGKTRAALHAFDQSLSSGGPRTLVVTTPAIGREVWRKELEDEMGLGLPVLRLYGRRNQRGWADLPSSVPKVVIVGWDVLADWLPVLEEKLPPRSFSFCVDEPHEAATNPQAKRYQAARRLGFAADRTWELTGTWYKNSALDIYHQLRLIPRTDNPFRLWTPNQFADQFCKRSWNPFAGRRTGSIYRSGRAERTGAWEYKGLKDGAEEELLHRLQGLVDKRLLADCMDVPQERRIPRWLDVGDGQLQHYDERELEAAAQRLIPRKVERVLEYLRTIPDRPVVVFGWHTALIEKLAAALGAPFIHGGTSEGARTRIQQEFARGEHPYLICNQRSAGKAIDLASAQHGVFAEPYWSAVDQYQAEFRIKGPKQRGDRVTYHYLLFSNSVDEYIWNVKLEKGKAIDRLNRAGKEVLSA